MPHYLIQGSYTADGAQGLLAEGGTARITEATGLIEALGGTLECLYFIWGTDDIIGITEMPDDASAASRRPPAAPTAAIVATSAPGRCRNKGWPIRTTTVRQARATE